MRTLLICLACLSLVGCAARVPAGMEGMGRIEAFRCNSTGEQDTEHLRVAADFLLRAAIYNDWH